MTKPVISTFNAIAPLIVQQYAHYLPTAFNESLSLLQKMNIIINKLAELGEVTNGVVEQWNEVMEWVMNEGLSDAVSAKLDEMVTDGTLNNIINNVIFGELNEKVNAVSIKEYEDLKATISPGNYDWSPAINQAIIEAQTKSAKVFIPKGVFPFYNTIYLPEFMQLEGTGESDSDSVLKYMGSANGWAIKTSGLHQRNTLKDFRLDMNGLGNGIKLGLLGGSLIPVIFEMENVSVANVGNGYQGIECNNLSHVSFKRVRIGYGTIVGGNGLKIYADGGINSGVFKADDCVFGRVDATDVALEINGNVNLDSYNFDTCYFGGQRIKIGQSTVVRSLNFEACHAEFRLLAVTTLTKVTGLELYQVYGGGWNGGTITTFNQPNTNAISFKSNVKKFNVMGLEANGVSTAVFTQDGGTTVEGCILQEANITNGGTAVQFENVSDSNMKLLAKRLQHEIINTKFLYSIDQVNKEYWGTAPDPLQGHTRGDRIKNPTPSTTRNIKEWICTVSGEAGGGYFTAHGSGRGTTVQRPPLTGQDDCYTYFDTTLGKMIMWDGTQWLV